MPSRVFVGDFELIVFSHKSHNAEIYIEKPLTLTCFQIAFLRRFFERRVFYCGENIKIDVVIQKLPNELVNATAYFYGRHHDYSFCGNADNVFLAMHCVFDGFFGIGMSEAAGSPQSINGYYDCDDGDDEEETDDLGRMIDDILRDSRLDNQL